MGGTAAGRLDEDALNDILTMIMRENMAYAGYDVQLIVENVGELAKDIRSGYPGITLDEIRLVCKAGLTGELGDIKRPSCAAVMRWIDAYLKSPMRADAKRIQSRPRARVITREEGESIYRRNIPLALARRVEAVRTTGRFAPEAIPHVSAQVFDWLRREGDLTITRERWAEAVEKAKKESNRGSIFRMENIEGGERLIRSLAKHIALKEWICGEIRDGRPVRTPETINEIYN